MDDRTERACGDADRIGSSAVVADSGGVGEDTKPVSANSASIDSVGSCSSGNRDLDALRPTPGEGRRRFHRSGISRRCHGHLVHSAGLELEERIGEPHRPGGQVEDVFVARREGDGGQVFGLSLGG